MCGIIGYTGKRSSLPVLMEGLKTLEYRGYDSAGVALQSSDGTVETVRAVGRLEQLQYRLAHMSRGWNGEKATCGIGHTRWATHGTVSEENAHPQTAGKVSVVHNGIIENEAELEKKLMAEGYRFVSETDTERAAAWMDFCYRQNGDPVKALFAAAQGIQGAFAFGVLFEDHPDEIYAMRRDSPLVVALTKEGCCLASDVTAILGDTDVREYYRPDEGTVAVLDGNRQSVSFFLPDGKTTAPKPEYADWSMSSAEKGNYGCFMEKEIFEQPAAIRRTVRAYWKDGLPEFGRALWGGNLSAISGIRRVHLIACGTAMHAGLIGARYLEKYARIPAHAEIASEFRYRNPLLEKQDLVILLSQSGETSDTLAALRYAKGAGVPTLAVVNVPGSAIAREADAVLYTLAGPEIAVASTKAYSTQCAVLMLIALQFALARETLSVPQVKEYCRILLEETPLAVRRTLEEGERIGVCAEELCHRPHLFFIGRNTDWDLCREASLKLKEITYLHSEAYAAGELKHGTISLISKGVPVIAVLTVAEVAAKTISGIREVIARGADVTVLTTAQIAEQFEIPCDRLLILPKQPEDYAFFSAAAALQLLAYQVANRMGMNVDQPRNLAKSVTVE